MYIVDHLNPGVVIHRRVEVSNGTTEPVQVSLYAAAATITGGSFIGSAGHTANDLSTWTSVLPGLVDLKPGGKQMSTVTVTVPVDAAPGEQYGVVWAEVRSAPKQGAAVAQVSRVGIRLYVSIGPGGPPAAKFTIDTLTASRSTEGLPVVNASVHNTGGRAIDLSGTLSLAGGPGGLSAGPFSVKLGTTVGVGDTEPASVVLDRALPAGPWNVKITMRSGFLEVSEQATLTFPAAGQSAPVNAVAVAKNSSVPGWLYPAFVVLAVLLLAVAGLLVFMRRRRRGSGAGLTAGSR